MASRQWRHDNDWLIMFVFPRSPTSIQRAIMQASLPRVSIVQRFVHTTSRSAIARPSLIKVPSPRSYQSPSWSVRSAKASVGVSLRHCVKVRNIRTDMPRVRGRKLAKLIRDFQYLITHAKGCAVHESRRISCPQVGNYMLARNRHLSSTC